MTPADPLQELEEPGASGEAPRQRFAPADQGFDEVPKKYRRLYRRWKGGGDPPGQVTQTAKESLKLMKISMEDCYYR